MVLTRKFSEFNDGGTLVQDNTVVGLESDANTQFTTPPQFLEPGTTAQRPSPATAGMIRYNTDLNLYEFYNGVSWEQLEAGGDVAALIARLAAHTVGDGASMIGLENQGSVSGKTVQDLADVAFIAKNDNGTLVNGVFLDALATGLLVNETATGNLIPRSVIGTASQIEITNGNGLAGNIQINIAPNPILAGTESLQIPVGTTAQRPSVPSAGDIRYNSTLNVLEFWDNNASQWVQVGSGSIGSWMAYTPTFTGMGTPSNVQFWSRRVGDVLEVRGRFTSGISTATEARITLGYNGINANVNSSATVINSIQLTGYAVVSAGDPNNTQFCPLIESNVGYITFGLQSGTTGGLSKVTGGTLISSGTTMSLYAFIPVTTWP